MTTTEPSDEPSLPLPSAGRTNEQYPPSGGELLYPKVLTRAQNHALHDRLTVLPQDQAQQVLDELSGRMAITQVKNPIRYCATLIKRMQRGEFLPELGLRVEDARQAERSRRAALVRIEDVSLIESRSQPRELPLKLGEAIRRMRAKSSARSKADT